MDARRGQNVPTSDYECLITEVDEPPKFQVDEHDSPCFREDAQKAARSILVLFV
jgi:hypothetical protein